MQPNAAAQFWAKLQMQFLATNAKNKSTVIQLSKRFNLPSKYTSWLALPEEGRKIYEKFLKQNRDEVSFHRWKSLVIQGKGNTAEAKSYLATYKSYMKRRDRDPNQVINERIFYLIEDAASRITWIAGQGKLDALRRKSANRYMHMLQTFFTDSDNRFAQRAKLQIRYAQVKIELLPDYFALRDTKNQHPHAWKQINQKLAVAYRSLNYKYSKITGNKTGKEFRFSHDKDSFVWSRQRALNIKLAEEISNHGITKKSQELIKNIRRLQSYNDNLYGKKNTLSSVLRKLAPDNKEDNITDYKAMAASLKSTSEHVGKELGLPQDQRQEVLFKAILPIINSRSNTYFANKFGPDKHLNEMSQIRTELTNVASVLGVSFNNLVYLDARRWAGYVRDRYPYKVAHEKLKENPDKQKLEELANEYNEATHLINYKPEKFREALDYRPPRQPKMTLVTF